MPIIRRSIFLWILSCSPSWAFLGVGDITFDPAVHAELVSLYEQAMGLYQQVIRQTDRLRMIDNTIRAAQRDEKIIANTHLAHWQTVIWPSVLPAPVRTDLIRWQAAEQKATRWQSFYKSQVDQLQQWAHFHALDSGGQHNLALASTRLGEKTSSLVTAQSTATLAVVSAQHAENRKLREVTRARAVQHMAQVPARVASIYAAMATP